MDVYKPIYPGLYYFDTFTFTTLGTSGRRGPVSTKTYANAPWSAEQFSIVNGQQQWTVPVTGTYHVTAAGAYATTPGRVVSGDINLAEGQIVSLLVGQQPTPLTANVVDATTVGGGGGTFIGSNGKLLVVASGGDGTGGHAASFSPYGTGNGKNGGGYLSNGLVTSATFKFLKPEAYVDGGFGNSFPTGVVPEEGGFGGGQSPVTSGISGGGGYTGSPGDGVSGATCYAGASVANFTDLGAASNTAGTVTISLIDPAPIKQTWSWNQFVQPSPEYVRPFLSVQWSSQLNKFVSITSTSLNGVDWEGGGLLEQRTYNRIEYIAYSPELEIYVGSITQDLNGSRLLKYSSDAINWTSTNVTNPLDFRSFVPHSCPIIWSPELILFVCVTDSYIYSSSDGITWSTSLYDQTNSLFKCAYAPSIHTFVVAYNTGAKYSTDGQTWIDATVPYSSYYGSVSWSPSLSLFVIVSRLTSFSVLISSDGQTWTTSGITSSVLSYQWNAVVWADFCGKFTALGYQNGKSMYSSDGLNWSILGTTTDQWDDITVSNEQKNILAISQTNFLISIDGIYWVPLQNPFPAFTGIWSLQLGLFVTSYGFNHNIYYSNNAITWNSTVITGNIQYLTWSPELGILIGTDSNMASSNIWDSHDGISWSLGTGNRPNISQAFSISWSPELGIFSGAVYSSDGINWSLGSGFAGGTVDSSYSSWSRELGLFVLVHGAYYYYSIDGKNWTQTGTNNLSNKRALAYSPTLNRFIFFASVNNNDNVVVYSDDGMSWNSVLVSSYLDNLTWNNELQIFISIGGGTSPDGLTWTPFPTYKYTMGTSGLWSPELGRFACALGYSDASKTF